MKPINFLLAGVGGQGTILAADVLANVGLAAGLDAKQAEVHGMSQRGGSVTSYVRWGREVHSPIVGAGEVDVLIAFEKAEALRNLDQLRSNGLVIVNMQAILPLTVLTGEQPYPEDDRLRSAVAQVTGRAHYVDAAGIARQAGSERAANVVLLGALAALLGPGSPGEEVWLQELEARVPDRFTEMNRMAFRSGFAAVEAPRLGD